MHRELFSAAVLHHITQVPGLTRTFILQCFAQGHLSRNLMRTPQWDIMKVEVVWLMEEV